MQSPYGEGGASKGNRSPAVSKRERKTRSSSSPKAKKTGLSDTVITRSAESELKSEGSLEAGAYRPGSVPPPMNGIQAKPVKAEGQGELLHKSHICFIPKCNIATLGSSMVCTAMAV